MCDVIKKIFKVVGILVAIAGAVAGVYYLVTKVLSCSCCDAEEPVEVEAK